MNEPTQLPMRETGLSIERELSEMLLTRKDLANSLASLRLWSKLPDDTQNPDTAIIKGSLFRDGITQFVGCFDRKNAFPLVVETLFPNLDGIDVYFRWLRALRNSYTAHRHGAARQCAVGIIVHPETGEYLGHGHLFTIYGGPNREGHNNLLTMINMTINYVDGELLRLQAEFEAAVKAMPPGDRLKLPVARTQGTDPINIGQSRGDIRKEIVRRRDG